MVYEHSLKTEVQGMYDVTQQVYEAVRKSGVQDGICVVFCPHTTAGVTINENADPDVVHDLLFALDKAYPDRSEFRHAEGNSSAHVKASCIGSSVTVLVENGGLLLGTWQGIYICEFDGPRTRRFFVKVVSS
ncbi:MAG TPA: secondary thiamine-phosphate synthase enzyme YjbQ [Spirochaetia bacterium]|jgi:secondary thiamine-phosphate synthase enzyme|nr:secondary thiamine-phosphate synthase enzyme YjbQ [Spirochaetia bacterium]